MDKFTVRFEDTLLLVIDVQQRLAPAMAPHRLGRMVENLERLGAAAKHLDFSVLLSEQYPKGLGPTVDPIRSAFEGHKMLPKVSFSVWADPDLRAAIEGTGKKTVLVAGMEAHVCVWQTVRDLLPDHNVHVLADALASRSDDNYQAGLGLCERAGAVITSTETVLFDMLQRAGGDTFKAISKIVR